MKKMMTLLLCFVLVFTAFTGCGSDGGDDAASASPTPENPITIKCATLFAEGHPVVDRMTVYAEKVAEGTNGAINIKIFPSDTLGDSTVCFEEVMKGTIDMTFNAGTTTYSEIFNLPLLQFLASSYEEAEELYGPGNWMHNKFVELAAENNLTFLGFDFVGVGGMGFVKEPTNLMEWGEDKGVLLRCAPLDIASRFEMDWGFRTTSINYSDLYTSLQTGVCDGWAGGQPTVNYLSFGDVIKYYIQTDDFYELNGIYVNQELWNTFTAEQQEVFQTAATELYAQSFADLKEDTQYYMDLMEEAGIKVTQLTDDEKAFLADKAREVTWPHFYETMGKDTFAEMFASYDFLNQYSVE